MSSFGETLKRERELRGISLRDIADGTKISVRFLQALEEDRVEVLPGGLFPRAFVRQYALYLGLDAERMVAEFVSAHGEPTPPERKPVTLPLERRSPLPLGHVFLGAIAVLAVALTLRNRSARGAALAQPHAAGLARRRCRPTASTRSPTRVSDAVERQPGAHAHGAGRLLGGGAGRRRHGREPRAGAGRDPDARGATARSCSRVGNAGGLSFTRQRPARRAARPRGRGPHATS